MKNIILGIKGFIIGIANIIPGVSGGTLAITLGIYDELIGIISHFFKNIKKNIKFILPILIGALLAILIFSKIISFCLDNYIFPTIMFFVGAILGGIPMLQKKIRHEKIDYKKVTIFILTFSIIILLTFIGNDKQVNFNNMNIFKYLILSFVGMIAAATMIIPGISGSAVLMTIGYYEPVINILKDLTNISEIGHNLSILIPFGIGIIIGIIIIAKLIEYLLKNHEVNTYYGIIGFVISSVISIIIQNFFMNGPININILSTLIGIILFGLGLITAYKLGDK